MYESSGKTSHAFLNVRDKSFCDNGSFCAVQRFVKLVPEQATFVTYFITCFKKEIKIYETNVRDSKHDVNDSVMCIDLYVIRCNIVIYNVMVSQ